jgi:hypothetical protein
VGAVSRHALVSVLLLVFNFNKTFEKYKKIEKSKNRKK